MAPERWQQISQLCEAALARDVAERTAFESLLAQESRLESLLKPTPESR